MARLALLLLPLLAACGFDSKPIGPSVTIKLPPPKAAAAPGFSTSVTADVR